MKIFQNKPVITAPALLASLLAISIVPVAQAQQSDDGPVNLLATVNEGTGNTPTNTGETEASADNTPSISSIDEAVNAIAGEDNMTDKTSGLSEGDGTTTSVSLTETPSVSGEETTDPDADTNSNSVDEGASIGVTLSRTAAPEFGIADIGIEAAATDLGLTATIWRDTPVDRVAALLSEGGADSTSRALSDLSRAVVAHRAVPPVGSAAVEDSIVAARLKWLAASGRSNDLAVLIDQLPNEDIWLGWKQWLVETQLMSRRDAEACRNVMYQVSRTLEPFWHKSKVICSAAQGDSASARFAADILFATGVQDDAFKALVSTLLDGTEPGPFDPAMLDPLHVVLMDAAHYPIGVDALAALPPASEQTAIGLRYLDPEARLVSTWRALSHGLIDHTKAAKLWRSVDVGDVPASLALSRHQGLPTPLTRALAWRALSAETTAARLPMIVMAMDIEVAAGTGLTMAPLYADLVREALAFDGAGDLLASGREGLVEKLGLLLASDGEAPLDLALASDVGIAAAQLMTGMASGTWSVSPLDELGLWHLLPLMESAGAEPDISADWMTLATPASLTPTSYLSVSPVMMRALEQAASGGRVGEAALLAQRIVAGQDLTSLHPADLARIAAALNGIGQQKVANAFVMEVTRAHILASAAAITLGDPVAVKSVVIDNTPADAESEAGVSEQTGDGSGNQAADVSDDQVGDEASQVVSADASGQVTDENVPQQGSAASAD